MQRSLQIVGIGDDGVASLTGHARQAIERAEVLIGPQLLLDKVQFGPSTRRVIDSDLDALRDLLHAFDDQQVVLLASGDPLFYGIARFVAEIVGKEQLEVIPHVSSMQLAFARIKESWDEAYLTNLANQPLDRVVETIRSADHVGLFTTEAITPAVVAETLRDRRIDYFTAYVCENLGSPDEKVTQGDLATIAKSTFGPLNVMILIRHRGAADRPRALVGVRKFGNPDSSFFQSRPHRGLLTPLEVRCVALAEMDLSDSSIVWDVGAGSGSLAIEAARLASRGQVFAIEMDAVDYGLMVDNASQFDCPALVPIHGQAPQAWADLPDPDAIFVDGAGRSVAEIVASACQRLATGSRIVVSAASIDNLVEVRRVLASEDINFSVRMINISHGIDSLGELRFEAANPTYLLSGYRG